MRGIYMEANLCVIVIISIIDQLASSEKGGQGYRILQVNALHAID